MVIFLSYSRQDEDVVKALVRGFEAAHRSMWFDHDLSGGDVWWDKILANIRSSSVFVFAVSDASLQSRACLDELYYAQALRRPLLPVRVGPIGHIRTNPLADIHMLVYRPDDANSGFEVLAAADAAAAAVGPLPDPLPPQPPIPHGYLRALGRQIDAVELDAAQQTGIVDQLRKSLGEETEQSVREEIFAMLRNMLTKPWVNRRTEKDIKAVLIANRDGDTGENIISRRPRDRGAEAEKGAAGTAGDTAARQAGGGTPAPTSPPTPQPTSPPAPGPASPTSGPTPGTGQPFDSSGARPPDARELFERRMAELDQRRRTQERQEAERRRAEQADQRSSAYWEPPTVQQGSGPATWPGVSAPIPETVRGPVQPPEQPTQPTAAPPPGQPAAPPPNYWALSIVSFLLSVLFGAIAMYFSYQVDQQYRAQKYDAALRASRSAKVWAIVGIVIGVLALLTYFAA
jgi:hypothetical protein